MSNSNASSVDIADGLEDVVVASTRMSRVDGDHGDLMIGGYDVTDLAGAFSVEELAARLLGRAKRDDGGNELVDAAELADRIGHSRVRVYEYLTDRPAVLEQIASLEAPMAALRAGIGLLEEAGDDLEDAALIIGAIPVVNAVWWHTRQGTSVPRPKADVAHARDYLRLLSGEEPPESHVNALEAYLLAVSDHGMNASTFTGRVITSTGSDLVSAVVGAIGALKGPLHGGAPGPVLDMLDAIGDAENAEPWLREQLESGERIMGMGHRVYRVRDPRATVFEQAVDQLREATGDQKTLERLELARAVEESAERLLAERYPDRSLRANVEFYTAVLLEAVGVPRSLFTNTFAAGRAAGWTAHSVEQRRTGRLIRPRSVYSE